MNKLMALPVPPLPGVSLGRTHGCLMLVPQVVFLTLKPAWYLDILKVM
jgi:hypothetical protein